MQITSWKLTHRTEGFGPDIDRLGVQKPFCRDIQGVYIHVSEIMSQSVTVSDWLSYEIHNPI